MSDSLLLGVDIGGTKVAAGLVNAQGEILSRSRNAMNPRGTCDEGLSAVRSAIDAVIASNPTAHIAGIGLIAPGPLDPKRGVIVNPPNVPCWRDYPLGAETAKHYNVPVLLDNDANAAALAEALWGAGKGYENVFYGTLGTGVGTGIIFDLQIFHGRTGAAAEGGHMSIDYRGAIYCGCGKPGCVEGLISGTAIARRARRKVAESGRAAAKLVQLAGGSADKITGEMVGQAWREGDQLAAEILEETADIIAVWLGNIVDLLEPDVLVIGGGVSELMQPWFDHIHKQIPRWSINQRAKDIPLVVARYGNEAGIAGAAALCLGLAGQSAARG